MNKRKYIFFPIVALLLMASETMTYAANTVPTIYYNNKKIDSDKSPIIKDGTTYVPLRMLSELFGKGVDFDSKTYRVNISDKNSSNSDSGATTQQQIATLQAQVQELKDYITTVQNQTTAGVATTLPATGTTTTSKFSIEDLQSILNGSDYRYIGSFLINDMTLSGDSSHLTIGINADLKAPNNNERWTEDLTKDALRAYLSKVCDKIRGSYPNVIIDGKIKNTSYIGLADTSDVTTLTQYLADFTSDSSGTILLNRNY